MKRISEVDRRGFLTAAGAGAVGLSGCVDVLGGSSAFDGGEHDGWVALWNKNLLDAIRSYPQAPVAVARQAAMVNVAVFDAVNGINAARGDEHYESYGDHGDAPADASEVAAVTGAAHRVISHLYPEFEDVVTETSIHALDTEELDGDAGPGVRWGANVADDIIELRRDDGHDGPLEGAYTDGLCSGGMQAPGCWRAEGLTGKGGQRRLWLSSHYAWVDTWCLDSPAEFPGPPSLDSEEYADAWHEVYDKGDSRDHTQEETDMATYWFAPPGTTRPPGRWIRIACKAAEAGGLSTLETARLLALVSLGLADAGVSVWRSKHSHGLWRPQPAIHEADIDGNPDTFVDESWTPLKVGGGPEYPSGLTCFGSTATNVLVDFFGSDDLSFEMTTRGPPAQTRSFDGFRDAFEESWRSRLYLGIHYRFALEDAIPVGEEIAETLTNHHLQPV